MPSVQLLNLYVRARRLQRRNHSLLTMLGQCRHSRDAWKQKALERSARIEALQKRIKRLERRVPTRTRSRNPYGLVQLSTHDLRRLEEIPPRPVI